MSEPQLKKRLDFNKPLSANQRKALAERVISHIQERTAESKDINGESFAPYSNSYIKSQNFRNAGKDAKDVNLRLTSEMMESIQLLEDGDGYITIGFEPGQANDKGVWQQRSDNGPQRLFLGISESNFEFLVDDIYYSEPEGEQSVTNVDKLVNSLLKELFPED